MRPPKAILVKQLILWDFAIFFIFFGISCTNRPYTLISGGDQKRTVGKNAWLRSQAPPFFHNIKIISKKAGVHMCPRHFARWGIHPHKVRIIIMSSFKPVSEHTSQHPDRIFDTFGRYFPKMQLNVSGQSDVVIWLPRSILVTPPFKITALFVHT